MNIKATASSIKLYSLEASIMIIPSLKEWVLKQASVKGMSYAQSYYLYTCISTRGSSQFSWERLVGIIYHVNYLWTIAYLTWFQQRTRGKKRGRAAGVLYLLFHSILGCVLPLQEVALHWVLQLFLSFAILVNTTPCCPTMSSLRRFPPTDHPPFICHSVLLTVHLLSFSPVMCPAHFHFVLVTYWTMSVTPVLCLRMVLRILSFRLTFSLVLYLADQDEFLCQPLQQLWHHGQDVLLQQRHSPHHRWNHSIPQHYIQYQVPACQACGWVYCSSLLSDDLWWFSAKPSLCKLLWVGFLGFFLHPVTHYTYHKTTMAANTDTGLATHNSVKLQTA